MIAETRTPKWATGRVAPERGPVRSALCMFGAMLLAAPSAQALQPLALFVAAARANNPDNREAAATENQRAAQLTVSTGSLLPSVSGQGTYTRNQYPVSIALAGGPPLTITPLNQFDGYLTVAIPVVNVGSWKKRLAAEATLEAADATRTNTQATVETSVARTFYQVLADEALLFSARKTLDASESNVKAVSDRKELGTASELDLQRAVADSANSRENVATTGQSLIEDRRSLETLTGLTPEPAALVDFVDDDLHAEAPLSAWTGNSSDDLLPVRVSALNTEVAERNHEAALAAWLPTLTAQGQEHLTNATGFTGKSSVYTLSATVAWSLDFTIAPTVRAQAAALEATRAREYKARRSAEDAIFQAWTEVSTGIEKARAARAQAKAATLALNLAQDRYASGVATQVEVVQAQRDFFSSAVSQAQADGDLHYARALLRITARRSSTSEK